jgi:hypothetical protein
MMVREILNSGWTDVVGTLAWIALVAAVASHRPLRARARARRRG